MTHIFAMHGIMDAVHPNLFVCRNMTPRRDFIALLEARRACVPLSRAMQGEEDALTIDDATRAGARAALAARERGHEVTLFVNPWYVAEGRPYFFALLNPLFDALASGEVQLQGETYRVQTAGEVKAFRAIVKTLICRCASAEGQEEVVTSLARENSISISPPEHLRTLTVRELEELRDAGIALGNHGWMHVHHDALSNMARISNATQGREWLLRELGVETKDYAVPFGEYRRSSSVPQGATWYLLDDLYPLGVVEDGLVNRTPIEAALRKVARSRRR